MLAEFVVISFATFIGYQMFRNFLPFVALSSRTAPMVAAGIAYSFTFLSQPSFLIAIAATGGAGLINKITDIGSPEPVRFSPRLLKRSKSEVSRPGPGNRIPSL